jgi:hypothetical protein
MGFRMVYKLSYMDNKKYFSFFSVGGGGTLTKKKSKILFFFKECKFIHHHPKHVYLYIF